MLSRIRFSCSLAAADGPWEETTDEAEKTSLRIVQVWEGESLDILETVDLDIFQDGQDCF